MSIKSEHMTDYDERLDKAEHLEEKEKTDAAQWRHHMKAFTLILIAFGVQLLRGN